MQVLSINGSRRKTGNTALLIESILASAEKWQVHTEAVFLGDYNIGACTGCEGCRRSWECVIKDDFAEVVKKIDAAQGVVLASPTYWYSVTSDMKRFIDRCYSLIQFPVNRKEWIGKYQGSGKVCITAAVCEQSEVSAMGNTLSLMTDFSRDIGLDVIESVTGLGFFAAGSIKADDNLLLKAEMTGQKLFAQITGEPPISKELERGRNITAPGERQLGNLLRNISPQLVDGEFVFCTMQNSGYGDHRDLEPIAAFNESEGLTLVIPKAIAEDRGLSCETVFKGITLKVHSSLEAVGLTAAFANKLAEHGIAANVFAGYFHDHIFVQSAYAEKAVMALEELAG